MIHHKTQTVGFGEEALVRVLKLSHPFTVATDQKLRSALVSRMDTGNISITTFDAMNQVFGEQKLERAINNRRGYLVLRIDQIQFGQYIVSAQGLMTTQQYFQNLIAAARQAKFACLAMFTRGIEQMPLTLAMIVMSKSNM